MKLFYDAEIYKKIDRPWDSVVRFVNVTLPEMGWGDGESQEVVMDVGCGPGRLTSKFILPRFPNLKELIALDIIPEMIEAAKSLYPHPKVEYVVADFDDRSSIEKWKGQLTKFVSIHCFNRLKHQKQAFETVYQLLKPKGEAAVLFLLRNGYYDAIMKLSKDPKWSEYLNFDVTECIPQSQQQNLNSFHFKKIVEDIGFTVLHCQETQNVTTFQSDEEYKSFYYSLCSFVPYIPIKEVEDFKNDLLYYILQENGRNLNGTPVDKTTTVEMVLRK
ncbi:uncharacterized protein LOC129975350 [Argiope bruennichi]|uniref:uncharacterized protein LOC129975350 n=1 Tax=Argiope bruennichi TaxID=94029 RepID=UPI002493F90C|nr:uncharacterized protein LOC129975350 [Argiope bruennichi]